jgi:glycine cleavage system regulatory protein
MKHVVFTFICADRPGLVDTLSNCIQQTQGNWLSSSMQLMSGFFTGVVEVSVQQNHLDELVSKINGIPDLNVVLKVADEVISTSKTNLVLELTANDRAGIVQEISSIIHQQGGNLLKLISKEESAPHSGQELFKAQATISVVENNTSTLIEALENLADDLMVDITH